jgi:hypothetical protein
VAGVEEADNRIRIVPLERLRARRQKERVVSAMIFWGLALSLSVGAELNDFAHQQNRMD